MAGTHDGALGGAQGRQVPLLSGALAAASAVDAAGIWRYKTPVPRRASQSLRAAGRFLIAT
jgi:hypothetical protein